MYFIARMPIEFYFENGNKVETTKFNLCLIFFQKNKLICKEADCIHHYIIVIIMYYWLVKLKLIDFV